MSLFDDGFRNNESVFLNEIALDFEYLPKELPHRENKQHYIADCIKPLLAKRNGKNLFVYGQPGIGKTAAIKHIIRELEEKGLDEDIYIAYINCWKKNTSHKIIVSICEQIGYSFTHNKTTEELTKKLSDIVNKKSLLLVLDEVDKALELDLIYGLLEEIYRKTVLLITNEYSWLSSVDKRLSSRLVAEPLEFQPYNYEETKDILNRRKNIAFAKNVWLEDGFESIVKKAAELKDIRKGLFLLRESGLIAEQNSSRKILIEHAKLALTKLPNSKIRNSAEFEDETKKILELIKIHSGKTTKEIFTAYKDNEGIIAYRTFHRKLKDLEKNKMITIQPITLPKGGQSSIIIFGNNL